MYEELVERLRETPGDWPDADLHYAAADAIEELKRQLAEYKKFDGFLMAHGMFAPVEWTLAELPKEE